MRKILLFGVLSALLLSSCDPVSTSQIYIINNSDYNLKIEALFLFDNEHVSVQLNKGDMSLLSELNSIGLKASDWSNKIQRINIYQILDNGKFKLLKSFEYKNDLFKKFKPEIRAMGSESVKYLFPITNDLLLR